MNRNNLKAPPAIQIIKDEARKLSNGERSPDSPKPQVIGKAHKFLWKQDVNLDIEVFKLAPKFGEYYCVYAVNVDTAEELPKVYVSGGVLNEIVTMKQQEDDDEEEGKKSTSFNREKEIINILTNGLSVDKDIKHLILPKGINGSETIGSNYQELGSPKVRSRKRTTMADFDKGFNELAIHNEEMSSHINNADKQMKLMRLGLLAFDNKKGFNYHDDSPKGRWHRAYRKIMYRLFKKKIVIILNKIGTYGQFEEDDDIETKKKEEGKQQHK